MMRSVELRGLWVGLAMAMAACGSSPCQGNAASSASGAPTIKRVDLVQQWPDDPWMAIFALTFHAPNGDLGQGTVQLYVQNNSAITSLPLHDAFAASGLPDDATSGTIAVAPRFAPTVKNGASVRMGFQVLDSRGERSNCYSLDLKFSVKQVARALVRHVMVAARRVERWLGG